VREPLRCRERRESHQSDGGIPAPLVHPLQRMSVDACRSFQGTRGLQRRKWVPAGSIATERRFAVCICARLRAPTDPRFRSPNEPHPLSTLPTGHPCISQRMWEMFGFCSSQVMRTPLSYFPSASHVKRVRARTRARAGGRTRAGWRRSDGRAFEVRSRRTVRSLQICHLLLKGGNVDKAIASNPKSKLEAKDYMANPNAKSTAGFTPLHLAARVRTNGASAGHNGLEEASTGTRGSALRVCELNGPFTKCPGGSEAVKCVGGY
jgi:hypothetical protein